MYTQLKLLRVTVHYFPFKQKKNCMMDHKNTKEEKVQYNRESTMNPQSSLKHIVAQTLSLDISKK